MAISLQPSDVKFGYGDGERGTEKRGRRGRGRERKGKRAAWEGDRGRRGNMDQSRLG